VAISNENKVAMTRKGEAVRIGAAPIGGFDLRRIFSGIIPRVAVQCWSKRLIKPGFARDQAGVES